MVQPGRSSDSANNANRLLEWLTHYDVLKARLPVMPDHVDDHEDDIAILHQAPLTPTAPPEHIVHEHNLDDVSHHVTSDLDRPASPSTVPKVIYMENDLDIDHNNCCNVHASVNRMMSTIDVLCAKVSSLERQKQSNSNDIKSLIKENVQLRHKITEMSTKIEQCGFGKKLPDSRPNIVNGKTLVVGSSIIRDISASKLKDTDVITLPGGLIRDVTNTVKSYPTATKYSKIVLVVGGNDCDTSEQSSRSASDIVEDYSTLVSEAKLRGNDIVISSVCPRMKCRSVTERVSAVNAGLQSLSSDEQGTSFIDNTPMFTLADGTLNDGYFTNDGIHNICNTSRRQRKPLNETAYAKQRPAYGYQNAVCRPEAQKSGIVSTGSDASLSPSNTAIADQYDDTANSDSQTAWKVVSRRSHRHRIYDNDRHTYQQDSYRRIPDNDRQSYDTCTMQYEQPRCYNCYESNHTSRHCRHDGH